MHKLDNSIMNMRPARLRRRKLHPSDSRHRNSTKPCQISIIHCMGYMGIQQHVLHAWVNAMDRRNTRITAILSD